MECLPVNTVIFGGGVAGLWTLDEIIRSGRTALLIEQTALGEGQTIASQGILHSGLKYSLQGLLTAAAREAREMPALWRKHLAGTAHPDLSSVDVCSQSFYLWGTDSAASRLGMFGARLGLHVTPQSVRGNDRPPLLARCPGTVYRVEEQVISPRSLLTALAAAHPGNLLLARPTGAGREPVEFDCKAAGHVRRIRIATPEGRRLELAPKQVLLVAGAGNAALRKAVGLEPERMQRRPLHMVLARGRLPEFYGHCVDGAKTRVSITSGRDRSGRFVWQIGGQIAEDGVAWDQPTLIARCQSELASVLPDLSFEATEWSTYRVDRAEGITATGGRPDSFRLLSEGNVLTAWPTKLVLAPQLARAVLEQLADDARSNLATIVDAVSSWPRPAVAQALWDLEQNWVSSSNSRRTAA